MSRKEMIFNSVNGSFVDGYGIRSTIFLKGCPLKCKWCCNPEGQSFKNQPRYIQADCNGCGRCLSVCPKGAISWTGDDVSLFSKNSIDNASEHDFNLEADQMNTQKANTISIDWNKCNHCGACTKVCFQDALLMAAEEKSAKELFDRIYREKDFYDQSGGGLTIGGGEASCFPEFCLELIELCHKAGIHVAIDTCGYTISEKSFDVLLAADLLLYDIKGINPDKHLENTGVSNERILENFKKLTDFGKPVIVRLPIIPGYNDSLEEQLAKIELLKNAPNVERVDVLPFHTYGKSKYVELGMIYPMPEDLKPLENGDIADFVAKLRKAGLNVQIGG